jgi:hypothetical protein
MQFAAEGLSKKPLLLLGLIACLHSSRDAAVLAPLGSLLEGGFSDEGDQPIYVVFGDSLTASVFRNLGRSGRYRIAPKEARLFCPSRDSKAMQGYQLTVRVDKIMGDSALATIQMICVMQTYDTAQVLGNGSRFSGFGQAISTGEHILLIRVSGRWKIESVISGFTLVPG